MKKQLGITFVELIFALAIAGILVSVGVPSFVSSIRNSEMVTTSNTVVAAVHAARSEAVKLRADVTLCVSDNSASPPACDASGKDLLVFMNIASDTSYDPAANDSGDIVVRKLKWLEATANANFGSIPNYITFNSDGVTESTTGNSISGRIVVCGPSGEEHARVITISPTGRPTVQHHKDVSGAPACPSS